MKIELDDWQTEAIDHKGDLLLATGRQVGKTLTLAAKAGKRMIAVPETQIIIASLTEDQAKLIIIMILDYLEKNHKKEIAKGKHKPTQNKVTLKNHSTALARPVGNTGDAMRGFTGNILILDEVARFNELILLSAKPTLASTGGELWLASTFFGRQGYFFECYKNLDNRFKVIEISTEQCYKDRKISESWTEERKEKALNFLKNEKRTLTELQYAQEYLGMAVEDLRQFFSDQLILSCMTLQQVSPIPSASAFGIPAGDYFLGVDVARMGSDETVLFTARRINDKLYEENLVITRKTHLTDTVDLIKKNDKKYNYKRIYIDDGGMGVGVFDPLLRDFQTKRKVVALNNATKSIDREGTRKKKILKDDLYNNLLWLMERRKIKLIEREETMQSLKSIQVEYKDQRLRIHGTYDHITEALTRAAWCYKEKGLNIWIA